MPNDKSRLATPVLPVTRRLQALQGREANHVTSEIEIEYASQIAPFEGAEFQDILPFATAQEALNDVAYRAKFLQESSPQVMRAIKRTVTVRVLEP